MGLTRHATRPQLQMAVAVLLVIGCPGAVPAVQTHNSVSSARELVAAGELTGAAEQFQQVADTSNDPAVVAEATVGRASCLLRLGRSEEAATYLGPLVWQPPVLEDCPARYLSRACGLWAELCVRQFHYTDACRAILRAVLVYPSAETMHEAGTRATEWSSPQEVSQLYTDLLSAGADAVPPGRTEVARQAQQWTARHAPYFAAYEGRSQDAQQALEALLQADPKGPLAGAFWAELAELDRRAGDWAAAAHNYEKAIKCAQRRDQEFSIARLHLAYAYQHLVKPDQARRQLQRVLERAPLHRASAYAAVELANLHLSAKEHDQALTAVKWLEEHFPANQYGACQKAAQWRARVHLDLGEYHECERELWRLVATYPQAKTSAAQLLLDLAQKLLAQPDVSEAERLLSEVASEFSDDPPVLTAARVMLGDVALQTEGSAAAARIWQQVLSNHPRQPWAAAAACRLAEAHKASVDMIGAADVYRWAYENHPHTEWGVDAAVMLPQTLIQAEQYDTAQTTLTELRQTLSERPRVLADALISAGDAYCGAGMRQAGEALYREVMESLDHLREPSGRAALQLAGSYHSGGRPEQALTLWRQITSDYHDVWVAGSAGIHLGRYHATQGEVDQAAAALEDVVHSFGNTSWLAAPALKELGLIHEQVDRLSDGANAFHRILNEYPDSRAECAVAH